MLRRTKDFAYGFRLAFVVRILSVRKPLTICMTFIIYST